MNFLGSTRSFAVVFSSFFLCSFSSITHSESITPLSEPVLPLVSPRVYNEHEVMLGKRLFNSPLLSRDNSISCASCHKLTDGGDDGLPVSAGIEQQKGEINTPTVLNAGLNSFQFWDGRAVSLEEQVAGPIHHPLEMGSSWQEVVGKLSKDKELVGLFHRVYQSEINEANIARAIAVYERQLVTVGAPFDQYLLGQENAINDKAKAGYQLFKQMGCISCHQGRNIGGNLFQQFGVMGDYFLNRGQITKVDYGRYNVTGKEEDKFKFKVPSLRNIALTAPYFHDASADTLGDAIRTMALYQLGRPIAEDQVDKIEAFLLTLTGELKEELK